MERISHWETGEYRVNLKFPTQWASWFKWIIPLILVIWLLSGIYIVGPDEQGVVRRFGRVVRITEPGPHYRLPRPIEKVDKPKIQQARRIEIGFETISPGPPARYRFHTEESLMLTGDEQIIDAQITVQYKIKDPANYLFKVRNLEGSQGTIKDAAEVALRQVVGERPIDDVLIDEKLQVEIDIRSLLQEIVDAYESGIRINEVKLQTVQPPQEVASSFSDVVSAKEDKDKLIQAANLYRSDFLEGVFLDDCYEFEAWQLSRREQFRQMMGQVLETLVVQFRSNGEHKQALLFARRSLQLDPWQEEAHRQVMLLLARTGQVSAALHQYQQCRQTLREELGVEPAPQTEALYARILELRSIKRPTLPRETTPLFGREEDLSHLETGVLVHQTQRVINGNRKVEQILGYRGLIASEGSQSDIVRHNHIVYPGQLAGQNISEIGRILAGVFRNYEIHDDSFGLTGRRRGQQVRDQIVVPRPLTILLLGPAVDRDEGHVRSGAVAGGKPAEEIIERSLKAVQGGEAIYKQKSHQYRNQHVKNI